RLRPVGGQLHGAVELAVGLPLAVEARGLGGDPHVVLERGEDPVGPRRLHEGAQPIGRGGGGGGRHRAAAYHGAPANLRVSAPRPAGRHPGRTRPAAPPDRAPRPRGPARRRPVTAGRTRPPPSRSRSPPRRCAAPSARTACRRRTPSASGSP